MYRVAEQVPAGHVASQFDIGAEVGVGAFGVIFQGRNKNTGELVAITEVKKLLLSALDHRSLQREVAILADCARGRAESITVPSGSIRDHPSNKSGGAAAAAELAVVKSFASEGEAWGESGLKERSRHILKFAAWFEEPNFYYTVTGQPQVELIEELCYASSGGSGSADGQRNAYTEPHCRRAFRGLASALACLAEKGVCHGNVRPETVLLMRRGDFSSVVLADFSLATSRTTVPAQPSPKPTGTPSVSPSAELTEREASSGFPGAATPPKAVSAKTRRAVVGSVEFTAPEVLSGLGGSSASDVWSMGALAFLVLSGNLPVEGSTRSALVRRGQRGLVSYRSEYWSCVPAQATGFAQQCLLPLPSDRASAAALLRHPWLVAGGAGTQAATQAAGLTPLSPRLAAALGDRGPVGGSTPLQASAKASSKASWGGAAQASSGQLNGACLDRLRESHERRRRRAAAEADDLIVGRARNLMYGSAHLASATAIQAACRRRLSARLVKERGQQLDDEAAEKKAAARRGNGPAPVGGVGSSGGFSGGYGSGGGAYGSGGGLHLMTRAGGGRPGGSDQAPLQRPGPTPSDARGPLTPGGCSGAQGDLSLLSFAPTPHLGCLSVASLASRKLSGASATASSHGSARPQRASSPRSHPPPRPLPRPPPPPPSWSLGKQEDSGGAGGGAVAAWGLPVFGAHASPSRASGSSKHLSGKDKDRRRKGSRRDPTRAKAPPPPPASSRRLASVATDMGGVFGGPSGLPFSQCCVPIFHAAPQDDSSVESLHGPPPAHHSPLR